LRFLMAGWFLLITMQRRLILPKSSGFNE
jgi:hypothetical protein